MAQSRHKRNQRAKRTPAPGPTSRVADPRRRTIRRLVLAFVILVGLAGIFAVTAPGDEPSGMPAAAAPVV